MSDKVEQAGPGWILQSTKHCQASESLYVEVFPNQDAVIIRTIGGGTFTYSLSGLRQILEG